MSQMDIFDYLEHDIQAFKDNPPTKISKYRPNSKFAKDYLYHIYEHVKTLYNESDIEKYLYSRFFMGREIYAPYAKQKGFLVNKRASKALLMIDNFNDFVFVINHCGQIFGRNTSIDNLIYPPNMSADKFRASLTVADKQKIYEDLKRLERLHSHNPRYVEHTKFVMNDYKIEISEINR